jgi:hypothetical protein
MVSDILVKINKNETVKRALKYLIEWFAISLALKFIPSQKVDLKEIIMVAIVGAIVFALLDMYSPAVSDTARKSTGVAIGLRTLGL